MCDESSVGKDCVLAGIPWTPRLGTKLKRDLTSCSLPFRHPPHPLHKQRPARHHHNPAPLPLCRPYWDIHIHTHNGARGAPGTPGAQGSQPGPAPPGTSQRATCTCGPRLPWVLKKCMSKQGGCQQGHLCELRAACRCVVHVICVQVYRRASVIQVLITQMLTNVQVGPVHARSWCVGVRLTVRWQRGAPGDAAPLAVGSG